MPHPCPRCGRRVGFSNASERTDAEGVAYCTSCSRLFERERILEEQKRKRKTEIANNRLLEVENEELEIDGVLSTAVIEARKSLSTGDNLSFRALQKAGRSSYETRQLMVKLAFVQARKPLDRTQFITIVGIAVWAGLLGFSIVIGAPLAWAFFGIYTATILLLSIYWLYDAQRSLNRMRDRVISYLRRPKPKPRKDRVKQIKTRTEIRESLAALSPRDFEMEVASTFRKYDYKAEVTPYVRDQGVDLILRKEGTKWAVQIKHFAAGTAIGTPELQKLQGAMLNAKADKAMFVALSYFSEPAIQYARHQRIKLMDGDDLVEMVHKIQDHQTSDSTQGAEVSGRERGLQDE